MQQQLKKKKKFIKIFFLNDNRDIPFNIFAGGGRKKKKNPIPSLLNLITPRGNLWAGKGGEKNNCNFGSCLKSSPCQKGADF